MGMYDRVNVITNCPYCGKVIGDFQSKDGPCDLSVLQLEEVLDFYTYCKFCKKWVEFRLNPYSFNDERFVPLSKLKEVYKVITNGEQFKRKAKA